MISLYHRMTGTSVRQQIAGITLALGSGQTDAGPTATFAAPAAPFAGRPPKPGDRLSVTDGAWWTVTAVGPLAAGAYPLTCTRSGT